MKRIRARPENGRPAAGREWMQLLRFAKDRSDEGEKGNLVMRRLLWLVSLLVIAYLLAGVAQVGLNERAVVRRFGAVVARPGPGLYVGLPWPLERIDRVPVGYPHKVGV